jgi:hypothetical protein
MLAPVLMRSEQRYRAYHADEGVLGLTPQGHR